MPLAVPEPEFLGMVSGGKRLMSWTTQESVWVRPWAMSTSIATERLLQQACHFLMMNADRSRLGPFAACSASLRAGASSSPSAGTRAKVILEDLARRSSLPTATTSSPRPLPWAEHGDRLGDQASTPKFLRQALRYSAATMLGELTLEEDSAERASLGLVAP